MNISIKMASISMSVIMMLNGCASYAVYKDSEKQVVMRKALASDNISIRAVPLGDDGVGIGVDVGNMEVLSESPWMQLGAAILDAAVVYAGYEGVRNLNDNGEDDRERRFSISVNDSDNTVIIIYQ